MMDLDTFAALTDEEFDALPEEECFALLDASRARDRKLDATRKKYWALTKRLDEIAEAHEIDGGLTDRVVDHEETLEATDWETGKTVEEDTLAYWETMVMQASSAAGFRAEAADFDINAHFDTPIY